MLKLKLTELDANVVATSIYGDAPHLVESLGLYVDQVARLELEEFMRQFCSFVGIDAHVEKYFRLDLYFDEVTVYVIEINVEVADGWGVSLNLLRATGKSLPCSGQMFPTIIPTFPEDPRQTEFELACHEFKAYGHLSEVITKDARIFDPLDSKLFLARFSKTWRGDRVKVPRMYFSEVCPWETVPTDVYLKFTDKFCPEAMSARYSVKPRSELGKAKQMRKLYDEGRAIAQERVEPYRLSDERQVQAVVMFAGSVPVTGYIQIAGATRKVINDKDTSKGALIFT